MLTRKIKYFISHNPKSYIYKILGKATESLLLFLIKNMKDWSDGSTAESLCFSFTRAEFCSQCPCQESHNLL